MSKIQFTYKVLKTRFSVTEKKVSMWSPKKKFNFVSINFIFL